MKRHGLRVLTLAICAVALVGAVGFAYDLADIAYNEAITEISTAAGLALGAQWAETKTVDELNVLAESARNGAIIAVETALAVLTGPTEQELYAMGQDEVLALAEGGDAAAATVYFFMNRAAIKTEATLRTFVADMTAPALLDAAAAHLAGIYIGFQKLSEDELTALLNGDDELAANAAAIALAQLWIGSMPMTAGEVEVALTEITGTGSKLAAAYQNYLVYLYSL